MQHATVQAAGTEFHVVTAGGGRSCCCCTAGRNTGARGKRCMTRLAGRFTLIAPDLRGFGASGKPAGPWGADAHAQDMLALLDALGAGPVGVVGHDVGGAIMLALARQAPERLRGLFFFDFAHPAIGVRMGTPDRLNEIWYQSFHQMAMAPALVGASRDTCRAYIGHFLRHWSHRKDAFDAVLEDWVDNFLQPGNLEGGFAYYRAAHAARIAMMQGAPTPPPVAVPTCVRWAEHDPIFPYAWTDRLGEVFSTLDLAMFEGVGHFPHMEAPDTAAAEIEAFFGSLAGL